MGLQQNTRIGEHLLLFLHTYIRADFANFAYAVAVFSLHLTASSLTANGTPISTTSASLNCLREGKSLVLKTTSVRQRRSGQIGGMGDSIRRM